MKPKQEVAFYYDFLSPYAYLAAERLELWRQTRPDVRLRFVPVLFAGLLNALGQKGPAEIPSKRVFTFHDVVRWGHAWKIPIHFPPAHPFNPLLPLRLMLAWELEEPGSDAVQLQRILTVYRGCWAESEDITQASFLMRCMEKLGSSCAADILARCQTSEVKEALRTNVEEALRLGVFGVPSFVVGETVLWGKDQLDFVDACLAGEDPVMQIPKGALESLPVGASRLPKSESVA